RQEALARQGEVVERGFLNHEYRMALPDGSWRWLRDELRLIRDEGGEPKEIVGSMIDITERKQAEEGLLRANSVLRAQQEASIDGILVVDEHQGVISYNRRFMEIWGVPSAIMAARDEQVLLERVLGQLADPEAFMAQVAAIYQQPEASSRDEVYLKDGRVLDRYSAPALSPEGESYGRVWYFRDISERKQMEQALQAKNAQLEELSRHKVNYVNQVSHELRTPLTSIMGYAEFLEEALVESSQGGPLEFVHQVQSGTRRLQRLVDDLLDFALIEVGTFKVRCEEGELLGRVREVVESFRPQLERAGVRLATELPAGDVKLPMDEQRVGQVLTNLLANAIKFTPRGGRITVRVRADEEAARVEVEDTGPGIAPEDQGKLFRHYSQLQDGMRRGGAGLGLAISRGIVEAHGGRIEVSSEAGRGSRFWFTLPRDGTKGACCWPP
ncbi:MAG: ATP-binding protein, partial [Candidatus Sericytochromatia bacterium]